MLHLASKTTAEFVAVALADLDKTLVDHAHCEQKAAVTALAFVTRYPDDPVLVVKLAALAQEEATHFSQLVQVCTERGLSLGHPVKDDYVSQLLKHVRNGTVQHRVDRLLVCALVEARSCERLQLLATALSAQKHALAPLYEGLWRQEAGHHALFVELAERTLTRTDHDDAVAQVAARLAELALREAEVVAALPMRPAIH